MLPKIKEQGEAVAMRRNGVSVKNIAKQLGVSPSSVSYWTKEVELTEEQRVKLLANRTDLRSFSDKTRFAARAVREGYQQQGREDARKGNSIHMQGCMLYWGEGSKNANAVRLSNTDGYLLKHFVTFLRNFYNLSDEDITVRVRSYDNGFSLDELQKHWLDLLGLPVTSVRYLSFYKDRRSTGKKKNRHIFGDCEITVCRTDIIQRIFGAIQEYAGFSNSTWLESRVEEYDRKRNNS